jgi:hypothetical protein
MGATPYPLLVCAQIKQPLAHERAWRRSRGSGSGSGSGGRSRSRANIAGCVNNRSIEAIFKGMEFNDPRHAVVRCAVMDYLVHLRDTCKTEIFEFHQVDGMEVCLGFYKIHYCSWPKMTIPCNSLKST